MTSITPIRKDMPTAGHGIARFDLPMEQAVLGILLYENQDAAEMAEQFEPIIFFEPTHQRIFGVIRELLRTGRAADALTVFNKLEADEGLTELGGRRYLADMIDTAPGFIRLKDYFPALVELWRSREIIRLADNIAFQARDGDASAELIDHIEKSVAALAVQASDTAMTSAAEAIDQVLAEMNNPSLTPGVKIGLSPIDDVTGGFMFGEQWILAGRPSMGKSALANSAALHVAMQGLDPDGKRLGVIEISCEMSVSQMWRRHVCDYAFEMFGQKAPSYSALRRRALTEEQKQMFAAAAEKLRGLETIASVRKAGLTVKGIAAMIKRKKYEWKNKGIRAGLVAIDHAGLVVADGRTNGRTEEQGQIARKLMDVIADAGIAGLTLVQLSRKLEERDNKRPQMSDVRDSGEWEQCCDGLIGVYRDAYYAQRELAPKGGGDRHTIWEERCRSNEIEAIGLKIREGEIQTMKLFGDMARNAIRGHAPENYYGSAGGFDFGRASAMLNPDAALGEFD